MNGSRGRLAAFVLCGTLLTAAGCKKTAPAPAANPSGAPVQGVLNSDGTYSNANGSVTVPANQVQSTPLQQAPAQTPIRNADGSITNPDGSVTYPAGSAVAQKEVANAANGSSAAPSGPAPIVEAPPVSLTVPVGTPLVVRLNGGLAASRNEVGDRFSGVLERPVLVHGATVFTSGTAVSGEVVASKGKGRFKGAGDLGIEVTAVGRDTVETSEYEKVAKGRGKRTAGFIGGGGGLGAIIGGLAGGGKGALIGGLAGAGAGTAAGAYTGNRDVVIPAESVITFRLRRALTR